MSLYPENTDRIYCEASVFLVHKIKSVYIYLKKKYNRISGDHLKLDNKRNLMFTCPTNPEHHHKFIPPFSPHKQTHTIEKVEFIFVSHRAGLLGIQKVMW